MVKSFSYLNQILTANDNDCMEVIFNVQKAGPSWYHLSIIQRPEGVDSRTLG